MGRLTGKHAIITGATGGMGLVACRQFCDEGAIVVGTDLDEEAGRKLEVALQADGLSFTFVAADVATSEGIRRISDTARADLDGRIDVLYNNHGIILGKPLLDTTEAEWDRIHDVDLKSVFLLTKAVVPLMTDGGSIINVASAGALVALPGMSAYCAAKGGLTMFSKGAAADLAPLGIRVNAICPGSIDTPMPRAFFALLSEEDAAAAMEANAAEHFVNRFGRPEEVVTLAVYLASDESTFMTGAAIPIDGGYTAR
ncbi:SDR family NAD(P)-dependent oxidoreductase [Pseudonocardia broussonetiae]|uniref:SDR family oxidoreductase n=1 Tax=Pseudonocardia broussonetiae TaxID=2736640 RepID=A0A6M6JTW7_9PSEU|nr:SDR family NAD(P)-dependent oxidoreductase [Pseudonocardia broussonetiae]QJY50002.1 SDR family oxidoreductase [Pseudonocardia broussonetiae]